MKKLFIFALFALQVATSQAATMADLLAGKTKLTFLGLDFTQARYIGSPGFTDPNAIENAHMVSWNTLIEAEPKKFSLQRAFKLSGEMYESRVQDMIKLNKSAKVAGNVIDERYSITEDDVKKSVSKYNLTVKDGIGVVYVVESLNKNTERMYAWVTFIDLQTKKVIYTELVEGKAGGFGFRNYWAGAVYKVNQEIENKLYKKWNATFRA